MNTAIALYGLSFAVSPLSTLYRTWEVGSVVYHVLRFTAGGVVYLLTPTPPPIEDEWELVDSNVDSYL